MIGSNGRGRQYSRARGVVERLLTVAYAGNWPARLWAAVPGTTRVRVVRHHVACLPPGRTDLRIGFVSDIHIGPTTPQRTLESAFALLRDEAPDVLMLGGDYILFEANQTKAQLLGQLAASIPAPVKLAVLGNHDLWDEHELLERALVRNGVEVLVNRAVHVPAPHDGVVVVGLDDPWTGNPDPDMAFESCTNGAVRVVLCHAPEGIESIRGRDVALMMCGHTHGGQVALPWAPGTPLYVQGRVGRRYWAGLHRVDGVDMFVSRGVGGVEIPFRIGAPPDVGLITLTSPASV